MLLSISLSVTALIKHLKLYKLRLHALFFESVTYGLQSIWAVTYALLTSPFKLYVRGVSKKTWHTAPGTPNNTS